MNASTLNELPCGSTIPIGGFIWTKSSNGWVPSDIEHISHKGKILSAQEAEQLPNGSRIYLRSQDCIMTKKDGLWHTPNLLAWGDGILSHLFNYEVL